MQETPVRGNTRLVALAGFLQQKYQLQDEGDTWTYEQHTGTLSVRNGQGIVFLAPDGQSGDATPNSLLKSLGVVSERASTAHYRKLEVHFRRTGVRKRWRDLTDEFGLERREGKASGQPPAARQRLPALNDSDASPPNKGKVEAKAKAKEVKDKEPDEREEVGSPGEGKAEAVRPEGKTVKRVRRSEKEIGEVFDRTKGRCYLCREQLQLENRRYGRPGAWHLEHVFAYSKRPDLDVTGNLLPAHIQCNLRKSALTIVEAVAKWKFPVLTDIVDHRAMLPEVQAALQEAKALSRKRGGVVVVSEALLDEDDVEMTVYPAKASGVQTPTPRGETRIRGNLIELRELGFGRCGRVYLGLWRGQNVALKRAAPDMNSFLINEAEILCALRHENLVHVHGWHQNEDDVIYLVMENISRGHLSSKLCEEVDAVRVLLDVARGMAFLHAHGFIHRDLKPNNILITEEGGAKVADFGLAKLAAPEQEDQTVCGTGIYIAPEVKKGRPYGTPVDVYSFGRIIQHILSTPKRPTHRADRALSELAELCSGPPASTKGVFAPRPERRPAFDDLVARLAALANKHSLD